MIYELKIKIKQVDKQIILYINILKLQEKVKGSYYYYHLSVDLKARYFKIYEQLFGGISEKV